MPQKQHIFTNTLRKLYIIPADPAGNKTIFVTTPVPRESYHAVASYLLSLDEYEAEQVAFILPDGSMEMCGLEFCGNASRTYGLIRAKILAETNNNFENKDLKLNADGYGQISINVSGCDYPLSVEFNMNTNYTKIDMPNPLSIIDYKGDVLVDLGGIIHLVTTDKTADPNTFQRLKNRVLSDFDAPALGVMFYDYETTQLTPVVYVADVDSTYFEGSCASGSVAVIAAMTRQMTDGEKSITIKQPKGTLTAAIKKRQNEIVSVSIEGPVIIGKALSIELPEEIQI